jgi:hypothetical protein
MTNEQFLTPEESADVDKALLTSPEKFLTRLTISSLRLLKMMEKFDANKESRRLF